MYRQWEADDFDSVAAAIEKLVSRGARHRELAIDTG